jgi:hypothetical protein
MNLNIATLTRALPHPHRERRVLPAPGLVVPHRRVGLVAEMRIFFRLRRREWLFACFAFLVADAWLLLFLVFLADLA